MVLKYSSKNTGLHTVDDRLAQWGEKKSEVEFSNADSKVELFLKGSLDLIPSPSPSVKIQIMGRKVCLRCIGKTLLGDVNKLFVFKSLLTTLSNVLPLHLKQTFWPITWIFIEGEGDGIKSRLLFKIFSTFFTIWYSYFPTPSAERTLSLTFE